MKKILTAEDDKEINRLICEYLSSQGYETLSAMNGLDAVRIVVKCRGHIALRTDDINRTAAVLEDKLQISDYKVIHGEEIHIFERLGDILHISKALTDSGLVIKKLNEEGQNLEDYYLEKAGGRHE